MLCSVEMFIAFMFDSHTFMYLYWSGSYVLPKVVTLLEGVGIQNQKVLEEYIEITKENAEFERGIWRNEELALLKLTIQGCALHDTTLEITEVIL